MLARELGTEAPLAEATDAVNEEQAERLARIVHARARDGDAVGILGLAYKPDTAVIEESPGVALAELLAADGARRSTCSTPSPPTRRRIASGSSVHGCCDRPRSSSSAPTSS